mmetsp:Transcript_81506/g.179236  ORF Transcript_81506/g.179236 Transcript_81506/m.179236 type:complete len:261 (+) Transcript_81506:489-1271(+)
MATVAVTGVGVVVIVVAHTGLGVGGVELVGRPEFHRQHSVRVRALLLFVFLLFLLFLFLFAILVAVAVAVLMVRGDLGATVGAAVVVLDRASPQLRVLRRWQLRVQARAAQRPEARGALYLSIRKPSCRASIRLQEVQHFLPKVQDLTLRGAWIRPGALPLLFVEVEAVALLIAVLGPLPNLLVDVFLHLRDFVLQLMEFLVPLCGGHVRVAEGHYHLVGISVDDFQWMRPRTHPGCRIVVEDAVVAVEVLCPVRRERRL